MRPPCPSGHERSGAVDVHRASGEAAGGALIRIDYHVHTSASPDARTSPREVVERALETGLGAVCVTDHDTIDGAVALAAIAPPGLRVVVGCEFTCADRSHVIGLGLTAPIAERRLPALLDALHAQGALVLFPHPFRRGSGALRAELRRSSDEVRALLAQADLVEAFNARDTAENNARSQALARASGLGAVAGSDAHRPEELGRTWVEYEEAGFVHGASARRIFGAPRPAAREPALKRRLLEAYHAHAGRLPALDRAYRALRARLHADGPPLTGAPRCLHVFSDDRSAPQLADGEAGPRRPLGERAARDAGAGAPRAGGGGPAGLAG